MLAVFSCNKRLAKAESPFSNRIPAAILDIGHDTGVTADIEIRTRKLVVGNRFIGAGHLNQRLEAAAVSDIEEFGGINLAARTRCGRSGQVDGAGHVTETADLKLTELRRPRSAYTERAVEPNVTAAAQRELVKHLRGVAGGHMQYAFVVNIEMGRIKDRRIGRTGRISAKVKNRLLQRYLAAGYILLSRSVKVNDFVVSEKHKLAALDKVQIIVDGPAAAAIEPSDTARLNIYGGVAECVVGMHIFDKNRCSTGDKELTERIIRVKQLEVRRSRSVADLNGS